jgi:hypothetical protein
MGIITPQQSAKRLRQIAAEMTRVARGLRAEAKALEAEVARDGST